MALSRMGKLKVFLGFFGVIAVVALFFTARYYYYRGYSEGTRTGYVRKISYKGPPYCKYVMGEMVMQQGNAAVTENQTWEFSIDASSLDAPLAKQLQDAERSGKLTTLKYRQDLHMWWRCAPTEYFITAVEK